MNEPIPTELHNIISQYKIIKYYVVSYTLYYNGDVQYGWYPDYTIAKARYDWLKNHQHTTWVELNLHTLSMKKLTDMKYLKKINTHILTSDYVLHQITDCKLLLSTRE